MIVKIHLHKYDKSKNRGGRRFMDRIDYPLDATKPDQVLEFLNQYYEVDFYQVGRYKVAGLNNNTILVYPDRR